MFLIKELLQIYDKVRVSHNKRVKNAPSNTQIVQFVVKEETVCQRQSLSV